MDVNFSKIARQLKILCAPKEYLSITSKPNHKRGFVRDLSPDYWNIVPRYQYSCCPFCKLKYSAQVDTYSLKYCPHYGEFGSTINSYFGQDISDHETEHCSHYVAVHKFINLNGYIPHEITQMTFMSAEVPMIQMHLLPDNIPSRAVMHAFPICRIQNNQFVPQYTLYILTYFSTEPKKVITEWSTSQFQKYDRDPEYYGALLINLQDPLAFDLTHWVKHGLLSWLDLDDPNKSLRNEPAEIFPYENIKGRKLGFDYRNAEFKNRLV
jgi:hypothetical protein